jgi:hypothetical protein
MVERAWVVLRGGRHHGVLLSGVDVAVRGWCGPAGADGVQVGKHANRGCADRRARRDIGYLPNGRPML